MKWFNKLDDLGKFIVIYGSMVLIGIALSGIYNLLNNLIDKL